MAHFKSRTLLQTGRLLRLYRSIQQFVDYLEMFSRYKQTENLHAMGAIFDSNPNITAVERAMLGNASSLDWHVKLAC